MKTFTKAVDMRSREAMTEFLKEHYRYSTANSWNLSTSYANCVKITQLGLDEKIISALLDMMSVEGAYEEVNAILHEFGERYNWLWQAGFNGRSGGYLVLYQGDAKPSNYKSYCQFCGQDNFTSVKETGTKCGRCGRETRVDYKVPLMDVSVFPGRGTDQNEDYEEWSMTDLKNRVSLVQEFDKLCDDVIAFAVEMASEFDVVEEEILVPCTRRVLKSKD